MQLFVNDEKLDVTLEAEKTVGDVLKSFEETCSQNLMTTIGINLNGKDIGPKDFDSILSQPLKDDTKINLTVISCGYLDSNFKTLSVQLEKTAKDLEDVSALLQSNPKQIKDMIKSLTDQIDFLCQLVKWSSLFPARYGKIQVQGKTLEGFFKDFSPILADFEGALKNSDTVTVGDLAEYEISPRLKALSFSLKSL